jgi:hypothetical protein
MTPKQKLQKDRAWFKFQLSGIVFKISDESLTSAEVNSLNLIKDNLRILKNIHDEQSELLGLRVPEYRCWCGKEAKYYTEYQSETNLPNWTCKKHKIDE